MSMYNCIINRKFLYNYLAHHINFLHIIIYMLNIMYTIIDNLVTISNLKIEEKLIIDENNIIEIDNRYILSFRRYVDGYCRSDIILPIISMYTHLFIGC